jgi:hypothetical protein
MADDLLTTRRRRRLVFGVVGIIDSARVAMALFNVSQARPHFQGRNTQNANGI